MKETKVLPLCFRCEYRALFHEQKTQPRYECGVIESAVHSCYMFRPVKPLWVAPNKGEKRPIGSALFGCRFSGVSIAEGDFKGKAGKKRNMLIYFEPDKGANK